MKSSLRGLGLIHVGLLVGSALATAGVLAGCLSDNNGGGSSSSEGTRASQAALHAVPNGAGCTCTGTGASGQVTVNCGETACGTDENTYICDAPGGNNWAFDFAGCGDAGAPVDSGGPSCTCTGTGASGQVTVDCGQTACGTDNNTYLCNSPGGNDWTFQSSGCASGGCSCTGTGANGVVTVDCGQTACGTDQNTYICTAPGGNNGWVFDGSGCGDAGSPPVDSGGPACSCTGTGANGVVTVNCGQTACGTDDNTYECTAPGGDNGWVFNKDGCCTPLTQCGAGQNCGTIPDGCGGTVTCGTCTGSNVCTNNMCGAACSCTGTGASGQVTVNCGDTACGTDENTYLCNAPGGSNWTYDFAGCGDAGAPVDSGSSCSCTGTGINGTVTVNCGQTTCGTDSNTYICEAPGGNNWVYDTSGCN